MPSYIPGSGDVSYIKPQYAATSLNRNMIFPGVPQSLPQLTPPPYFPQLPAPPTQPQPFTFSLDNKFGSMLENILMPREYGFKTNSYEVDILDDDIIDELPKAQQDQYIKKKITPQIEEQMKDINFDNEDDKLRIYTQAVSNKTAKVWGTRHANSLKPFDTKYKDNDNYKQNYISRLQEIINQDSIKTRGGIKTNSTDNKDKAKELLTAIGIKPELKVVVPKYVPPVEHPVAPPAKVIHPPEEKPVAAPPVAAAAAPPPPPVAAPPPPPPPPVTVAAGKGPPPPPPPPPKTGISASLLDDLEDTKEEKEAKEKAAKQAAESAKKGGMMDEMKAQQEKAPKQAGTKNGKSLSSWTEKYIDNLNYRKNYKTELEIIRDNEKSSNENKEKAKDLLDTFQNELIKRAREYAVKDTNMDTLYQFRVEYKEFKEE